MDAANVLDRRHIILTHCVRQRPKGARGRAFTIIDCTGLHAFEILALLFISRAEISPLLHWWQPAPREPTWLLIKMELPCSPSSRLFNNTSTYYCSQTQISQLLNNSKCFPGREEYSNREELISQKKCEYGKHLGRMSLPSSTLSNPVLWRSGNPLKWGFLIAKLCPQHDISYFLSYLWLQYLVRKKASLRWSNC